MYIQFNLFSVYGDQSHTTGFWDRPLTNPNTLIKPTLIYKKSVQCFKLTNHSLGVFILIHPVLNENSILLVFE